MTMQLCGASLSPYFERGQLVAVLKGAGDDVIKLGGMPCEPKSDEHFGLNPTGKIPFLTFADGRPPLIESQIIAEYLDAVLEGERLLPSEPEALARVQTLCRIIDLYLAPVVECCWGNRGFPDEEKSRAVAEDLPKAWDYLERYISDSGYAYGDSWSMADAALIPWLFHFNTFVSEWGDWDVGDRPKLKKWLATAGSSDIAKESAARSEKSLAQFIKARKAQAAAAKG